MSRLTRAEALALITSNLESIVGREVTTLGGVTKITDKYRFDGRLFLTSHKMDGKVVWSNWDECPPYSDLFFEGTKSKFVVIEGERACRQCSRVVEGHSYEHVFHLEGKYGVVKAVAANDKICCGKCAVERFVELCRKGEF